MTVMRSSPTGPTTAGKTATIAASAMATPILATSPAWLAAGAFDEAVRSGSVSAITAISLTVLREGAGRDAVVASSPQHHCDEEDEDGDVRRPRDAVPLAEEVAAQALDHADDLAGRERPHDARHAAEQRRRQRRQERLDRHEPRVEGT